MSEAAHEYSLMIREHHLDMFGHVNNAVYLQLLEEARWEWITEGGYGASQIMEAQQGPTILECAVRFHRELRNREPIRIRSWIESHTGKIARVRQEVRMGDGRLSCSASFVMGFFDVQTRKLIPPTAEWLAALGSRRDE